MEDLKASLSCAHVVIRKRSRLKGGKCNVYDGGALEMADGVGKMLTHVARLGAR